MSGDVEDRFLIGVDVLTLVGELAEERPVLIIAEDAQWLDEPSAVNIRPPLDALDLQEDAARALADDLRAQIDGLQTRLREAETHLEHLTIFRKTVTGLADRLPAVAPDSPEHPDHPRVLAAFNHTTAAAAKDVCEALGHELLPKNVEGTRAKLKRLVELGILTEADTGNFAREQ